MKLQKLIALLLAVLFIALPLAGCTGTKNDETTDADEGTKTDLEYILDKGTLVVGMTDYAPMNYLDDNGEWTGFDTEFANLVAQELGVEVKFVEIDWDNKWFSLETKDIDCVWNGMTLTTEAKQNANCTDTYVRNAQVVVTNTDKSDKYTDAASLAKVKVAVEVGSAGKDVAASAKLNYVEYPTQADALMAVESGKAEACIIDITMANAMTGEGTSYKNLTSTFSLSEEEYAIACRKNSDLTAKLNEIMADLIEDGTLTALAAKYELTLVADVKK